MLELIKRIIKWIIIAVLLIILIIFIVGLVKKTESTTKTIQPGVQIVKNTETNENITTNKNNNETITSTNINDNNDPYTEDVPDTASAKDGILIIIGLFVIGSGIYFVYKNKNVME